MEICDSKRQIRRNETEYTTDSDDEFVDAASLPTDVNTDDQLAILPVKYYSGDPKMPLQSSDQLGNLYKYALNPTAYSVIFILLVELIERFSFYGVNHTQTLFLTGAYDKDWNVGMTAVEASSYVSISTAVVYSSPFIGALMADCVIGDYWVILLGSCGFYIPGIALLALTTVPKLFGEKIFPKQILRFAILVLWPFGAGAIKSVVNIFGARQFHPQLQSSMIESYYVNFYMCINVGSLLGGILIPIIAQHNITIAYFIPVLILPLGLLLFASFTPRYVRRKPQGDIRLSLATLKTLAISIFRVPSILEKDEEDTTNDVGLLEKSIGFLPPSSKAINHMPGTTIMMASTTHIVNTQKQMIAKHARQLRNVVYISTLTIAFNVAYAQMATIFMIQGAIMKPAAGFIDAAMMHNADAISVLLCGFFVGNYLYPKVTGKICTTSKFAIGSFLGSTAVLCALMVEYRIHAVYHRTGDKISVLWQTFSYVFIGAGEIFTISTAYEVAFAISPKEQKALSSAFNLFCIGALPNFVCIALYSACKHWFTNAWGDANIETIQYYTEAHIHKYFWLLLIMNVIGMGVNLLPSVRDWVASVEEEAMMLTKDCERDDTSPLLHTSTASLPVEPYTMKPSKTRLHVGKVNEFILLNRHASVYGSFCDG